MGTTLDNYVTEITGLVQDGAGKLKPPQLTSALNRAVETYSRHRPRRVIKDLTGDGTGIFNVSSLTDYKADFSGDPLIEFPISTSGEPNYIDRREWIFYESPDGEEIRLLGDKPSASQAARFRYGALHKISITDAAQTTISDNDFYAVCKLAAAEALEVMARYYTQTVDGSVEGLDMSSFNTKGREYESRAKTLRGQYEKHLGIGQDKETGAASVTKNWDTTNSRGGDRLTHPRRFR